MTEDIFAGAEENYKRLFERFNELPVVIIHGLVDASGLSAGKAPPEEKWSINLSLVAWREEDKAVRNEDVVIYKQVNDDELKELQSKIDSNSLITFQGKICTNSPFGDTRALLVNYVGESTDNELAVILSEYTKPVEISDEVLGNLKLDKSVDWFEGTFEWNGTQIDIQLSLDESGNPDEAIKTAKALIENMSVWTKKVIDYAVNELLDLKNENWLDEGELKVSKEEFATRMSIQLITTYDDGEFEFWHDDGGLFWGHSIVVSGSFTEGLTDVDIPG
ncbi:MAG: DUF2262 domain-containing protein [Desulfobacterales bacterium]|nr:DUF2262 domain-containing protein [Desulfobacterales bacterium]